MNHPRIQWYRLAWSTVQNRGIITLVTTAGEVEVAMPDAASFHAVVDVLRNERPLFWNPDTGVILTANEVVGEEEMD